MSPRSFAILLAATALSVGLAGWSLAERQVPAASQAVDRPLFPDLALRLPEVVAIQVVGEDGTTTIRKDGEVWHVVERGGYPADPAKVREVARALAGLQLVETKTADADRLARLELEDPGGKAKSRQVTLEGADGKPIASAILGKAKYGLYGGGRGGVYVRRAGEPQSWLAAGEVELPKGQMAWIDNDVLSLPEKDIVRVVLGEGAADPITITRPDPDAGTLAVDGLAEGQKADQEVLARIASVLDNLSMTEVRKAAAPMPADAPRARFETRDGIVVTVASKVEGEADKEVHWLAFQVGEGQPAAAAVPEAKPEGEAKPAEAAKPLAERVAELKRRLEGWEFQIPSYVAERLTYGRDKLLAKPEGAS